MSDRPLHVAIDARCLNTPHLRGMGKMLFELVRRTAQSGAVRWHLLADRPDRPMIAPEHESIECSVFETKGYRIHSWEQWSLPNAARRLGVDVMHAPATIAPWWQPVPTVVTIHDTIPWTEDKGAFPPGFYRDRLLPAAYRRAAALITISETSRRDILARWPELKPKLYLVANGVDERYLDAEPDYLPLDVGGRAIGEPFVLYVGGAEPRKRLTWALQTWWNLPSSTPATMVVCGLEAAAHEAIRQMVPRHLHDRLVLAPFIGEEDMPRLYMRAAAVLYPTLYEGFGLPVVEAHAVGTPVLFSDVGSLSELKGPAAIVLPVDDLDAWSRALALVLQSRPRRFEPDRIARAWARQYSWDACADRTLKVYAAAAAHGRGVTSDRTYDVSEGARS
jgi:glycosyltransferase involved in cell wall biosynthesis